MKHGVVSSVASIAIWITATGLAQTPPPAQEFEPIVVNVGEVARTQRVRTSGG